jgi:hypothetical protein
LEPLILDRLAQQGDRLSATLPPRSTLVQRQVAAALALEQVQLSAQLEGILVLLATIKQGTSRARQCLGLSRIRATLEQRSLPGLRVAVERVVDTLLGLLALQVEQVFVAAVVAAAGLLIMASQAGLAVLAAMDIF